MDYNQESFLKPPFYMTYPMQNLYQAEMEYEKDMERMKELYPQEVKKILVCINDQCDELEYEGSPMYDEYPDRLMLERLADKIYELWKASEEQENAQAPQEPMDQMRPQEPMDQMRPQEPMDQMRPQEPMNQMRPQEPMDQMRPQEPMNQMRSQEISEEDAESRNKWFPMPEAFMVPAEQTLEAMAPPPPYHGPGPRLGGYRGRRRPWERSLIGVLLNDEIYRRRCRNRRCRRWW